jgi:hypothetical protein
MRGGISQLSIATILLVASAFSEAQCAELANNWERGGASIDFIPSAEMSENDYAALVVSCARLGNQHCIVRLGTRIVDARLAGADIQYTDQEALYILRQGLCPMEKVPATIDKDGEDFICGEYNSETGANLSRAYQVGIFGLPKSDSLSACWSNPIKARMLECLKLEETELRRIPSGLRPKGFSKITVFP